MLIFKDNLQALILFMSVIFAFNLFTTAFINVEMYIAVILTLFLPGYYYGFTLKTSGRMYTLPVGWYFYGLVVNLAEGIICCVILYIQSRKRSNYRSGTTLVKAEHVSAGYGCTSILRDINMELNEGDSLALIGNNGCGKTTFIKCVLN